jgi:hypothetical protein
MNYWVICKSMDDEARNWLAFPATEETLEEVVKIAKLGDGPVWVAEEKEKK